MGQVTIYLDEEIEKRMTASAKAMKLSKSRSIPGEFRTVVFPQSDERARVHRPDFS